MKILDALLSEARGRGRRYAVLDAQVHALTFYARRGFVPEGATFDDCGIPHQKMRVEL
jgi:predicted GNAT family N-acyltransferase